MRKIKRTIVTTTITALSVTREGGKLKENKLDNIVIIGGGITDEQVLKAVTEKYGKGTYLIEDIKESENDYSMDAETFMLYASIDNTPDEPGEGAEGDTK